MDVRRQLSFSKDMLQAALQNLREQVSGGVILSTCSRTEVYTMGHSLERSVRRTKDFLHRFHGLDQGFAEPYLYVRTGDEAASHLFDVAAGLDSVVLGEWQILDQVRQAMKTAANQGQEALPISLYRLFHGAVETGREARLETGFGEKGTDLGQAVARCAKAALGEIAGARVLIVGAGEIAKLTAQALSQAGVAQITIANRSMERGRRLADEVSGSAVAIVEIPEELLKADIVISATGAPYFTVTKEMVLNVRKHSPSANRALFIADLAVPADVDPQVALVENVRFFDIEQIQRSVVDISDNSGNEASAASVITKRGLARFNTWLDSLDAVPHIRKLQQRAERIRQQEMEKSLRKLTGITDDQLAAIDTLTRSIVKKLLHEPIQALKESAGRYELRGHPLNPLGELRPLGTPEYENLGTGEEPPTAGGTVSATA
ncbi:MAG: glutamyl-tRNA reductase [Chloroflexi bacterium]|nr:glutamyl-tRNA reductase [Chloroflexota bacterium]